MIGALSQYRNILIGGLIAALVTGFLGWLVLHDRAVIDRHEAKIEAAAAPARDQAAQERVADAIANTQSEKDLHHAIDSAPASAGLSPAAHALACERLRQRGRVPAACGSASGDGGKAGAR
jgi:hypothetical protein